MTDTGSEERRQKLFVGGLSRDTKDESLREYFEKFGEMTDCVVIRDSTTKESRGFGYVTFQDYKVTKKVLEAKRTDGPHMIDGKEVEVKRAIPRDDNSNTAHTKTKKVFIGGIPANANETDITEAVADALESSIVSVDLLKKKDDDSGAHRGFCFVEVENEDDADELCCIKKVEIKGKLVEMKKAEPRDRDGGGGGGGRGGNRGGARGGRGGGYSGRGRGGGYGGGNYGGGGQGYSRYGGAGGGSYDNYSGYTGGYDNSYNNSYASGGGGYGGGYDNYSGMGMYGGQSSYYPPSGGRQSRGRYQPY